MRILHVIHDFLPRHRAGSEIYAAELARTQLEQGHEVHVLCAEYDAARPHGTLDWRWYGELPVTEMNNLWDFKDFAETYSSPRIDEQLRHILGAVAPDLLHIHNLLNLTFHLPRIAAQRGIPSVATLHDFTLLCPSGGQRVHQAERHVCFEIDTQRCARCFAESHFHAQMAFARLSPSGSRRHLAATVGGRLRRSFPGLFERLRQRVAEQAPGLSAAEIDARLDAVREEVYEHIDLFVAPSPALGKDYERFGMPAEKIRVSDYGFAPLEAIPRERPAYSSRLRFGFVGTLVWHKGVHVVIEALKSLPKDGYELVIYGSLDTFPAYVDELRALAEGLPVEFRGGFDRDRTAEIYADMDVLIVASLWPENSPLVIHEAFQTGVPVVGARMGGIVDLVTPEEGGLLYDAFSPEDLAVALQRLVDDPELVTRLSRSLPEVKTIEQDAREWDAVYGDLLSTGEAATKPLVSIVLPTKNGGPLLAEVLDAIEAQQGDFAYEVVAVDSGSTDGTVELLRDRVDRLTEIAPEDFNHGGTRNLGIETARGEFIVLLVQDAVPASPDWLASLVRPLREDPSLSATWARQQPRPGASRLTRRALDRWIASQDVPRRSAVADAAEFEAMEPMDRFLLCAFDNVCSCVRRTVWEEHPFPVVDIAEDLSFSREVLLAGGEIAFVPEAVVLHSHERGARYEYERTKLVHAQLGELFGVRTIPRVSDLVRSWGSTLAEHWRILRAGDGPKPDAAEIGRALRLAVAWPWAQYRGGRD